MNNILQFNWLRSGCLDCPSQTCRFSAPAGPVKERVAIRCAAHGNSKDPENNDFHDTPLHKPSEICGARAELERRLVAIIEGEEPFDIFVRWKPVHEQPIGWEPDINDGVRLNLRPFMTEDIPGGKKGAGILRAKPGVHWRTDRGKEPLTRGRRSKPPWLQDEDWDPDDEQELRPQQDYPWFWRDNEFTGERRNDIHLTIADKSSHRLSAEQDDQ